MKLEEMGREVSFEDIGVRYRSHQLLSWFLETRDLVDAEVRPRIIEGGVHATEDIETGDGPWALIIEGELVTSGDLSFKTGDYATSTLIVTGHVRARNVFYGQSARVAIDRDLVASGVVIGTWGSDGAVLGASGTLTARAVLLDAHTSISANAGGSHSVPEGFRTLIVGANGWREFKPDILNEPGHYAHTFVPEVLRNGVLDLSLARAHAKRGGTPFLPEVEQALRAKKGL
ncbi:hypothetical protein [Hyalangium versicolor]|uniref:hypothetical protein n=1 Tax=Hyalangium versicolor TaxID=2861190 RepID=UPI001CCBF881|nr:hypothetical protein [Hyalangium versicolor]